ncbi:hypothetical protein PGB90_009692 [Kerria lacca]
MSDLRVENNILKEEIAELKAVNKELRTRMDDIDIYSRKNNVLISGIPATKEENVKETIYSLAEHLQVEVQEFQIVATHRLPSRIVFVRQNEETPAVKIREISILDTLEERFNQINHKIASIDTLNSIEPTRFCKWKENGGTKEPV